MADVDDTQPESGANRRPGVDPVILIVDDDDRNLFAMERALEHIGTAVAARSGRDALKLLLKQDFAVVLLDVRMPEMDGYETAALIRARARSRHVPIIFLTGIDKDDAEMLRGYAMGAVDYVFKPVDPIILRSKVSVFVELFEKTREVRRKAEEEQRLLEENFRIRTEKFFAEQALHRSEARQAAIIGALPLALYANAFRSRIDGGEVRGPHFIGANIEAINGFSSEAFDESPSLWAERIHPEDRERVLETFAGIEHAGAIVVEYRWRCADGRYRFFLDQAVLTRNDRGELEEVVGSWTDVTERRELEQQLVQAQKMDAIGKLTGGIAHDFNNMLTVVIGCLERLRRTSQDPAILKRVELALSGAVRCSDLTRQLLTFARRRTLQPEIFDLNELVTGIAEMVRRIIGGNIELALDCGNGPLNVKADRTQTESALLNLVVNARDAMPNGGRLTIASRPMADGDRDALAKAGIDTGNYVALTVIDTGVGIPKEMIDRVFEPFFTTKDVGKGTGLGLSIIYGFVKESGGTVAIDSEVGRGSAVSLYLPAAMEPVAVAPPAEEKPCAPSRARNGESVLVVEDDPDVRGIAVHVLGELGYRVLEAENGKTALDVLTRTKDVDLLFTDLAMPGGMNGRDLAVVAKRSHPDLRVLITSAHIDQLAQVSKGDGFQVLNKPYREDDLAVAIRRVLDGVYAAG
jgi:PAS domain S-box-containing protein